MTRQEIINEIAKLDKKDLEYLRSCIDKILSLKDLPDPHRTQTNIRDITGDSPAVYSGETSG